MKKKDYLLQFGDSHYRLAKYYNLLSQNTEPAHGVEIFIK